MLLLQLGLYIAIVVKSAILPSNRKKNRLAAKAAIESVKKASAILKIMRTFIHTAKKMPSQAATVFLSGDFIFLPYFFFAAAYPSKGS